jgi:hypothetical protein
MGEIYQSAAQVVVWLVPGHPDTTKAFQYLQRFQNIELGKSKEAIFSMCHAMHDEKEGTSGSFLHFVHTYVPSQDQCLICSLIGEVAARQPWFLVFQDEIGLAHT